MGLKDDIAGMVRRILPHTVGLILLVLSISLVQFVLESSLGKDWKFFDLVPVRYVADVGHLAVMIKFLWNVLRTPWQ